MVKRVLEIDHTEVLSKQDHAMSCVVLVKYPKGVTVLKNRTGQQNYSILMPYYPAALAIFKQQWGE